jgi:hypothetical protein
MRQGRLQENRDTPAGRYRAARFDYPNQSEFGSAEYIDRWGREYRLAIASKLTGWKPGSRVPKRPLDYQVPARGDGLVKMWVRFPSGASAAMRKFEVGDELDLMPLMPGKNAQLCVYAGKGDHRQPRSRVIPIWVRGFVQELNE